MHPDRVLRKVAGVVGPTTDEIRLLCDDMVETMGAAHGLGLAANQIGEEGCLSIPGFYETVKRAKKAVVEGRNLDDTEFTIECNGILARAVQHEVDHLNGILFIDHLSPVKKQLFKREYGKEKK